MILWSGFNKYIDAVDQVQGIISPPRGSYSRLVGAATARADWLRAFASRQNRQVGSTLCLAVGSSLSAQKTDDFKIGRSIFADFGFGFNVAHFENCARYRVADHVLSGPVPCGPQQWKRFSLDNISN